MRQLNRVNSNSKIMPTSLHTGWNTAATNHTLDEVPVLTFLRQRDQIIDHAAPRYWTASEHYLGLTRLGVSERLRLTPAPEWQTTYMALWQMGLGVWMVDWLELVMASHGGTNRAEANVVDAFGGVR